MYVRQSNRKDQVESKAALRIQRLASGLQGELEVFLQGIPNCQRRGRKLKVRGDQPIALQLGLGHNPLHQMGPFARGL